MGTCRSGPLTTHRAPFDVVVGAPAAPTAVVEVKLSDHNTLSRSLWDIMKLLGVLALSADHVYLIAGYPSRIWEKANFAALYTTGPTKPVGRAASLPLRH